MGAILAFAALFPIRYTKIGHSPLFSTFNFFYRVKSVNFRLFYGGFSAVALGFRALTLLL